MSYTKKRVDANQGAIVAALRGSGASVQSLAALGKGVPDLLVGHLKACPHCQHRERFNTLMEIKDGSKSLSRQALTPDEERFDDLWLGQLVIVRSIEEALRAVGRTM